MKMDFIAPSFDLTGRTAVVTGAGGGLGGTICLALASYGANIVMADVDTVACRELSGQIAEMGAEVMVVPCNVAKREEVENLVNETARAFGRLDIMVNNAGIDRPCKAISLSEDDWDLVMDVNLKGVFFGCVAAAKKMLEQGTGGRIINIASAAASLGTKNMCAYCASKAGVVNLTKTLAMEWGPQKITVNAVSPGYTPTNVNAEALARPQVKEAVIAKTALKRLGTPAEIASAVLFIASDASSMITGANIAVDMGTTCN